MMSRISSLVLGFVLGLHAVAAQAQVAPLTTTPIFSDDFAASGLDRSKWNVTDPSQSLQATQWGNAPTLGADSDGTTFVRLPLDTYNSNAGKSGTSHLGTQLTSLENWNLGSGLEYETRLRANNLPRGLVLGFFAYGDAGLWPDTYQKSETDYEFLSAQGGDKIWLNIWDDWNPLRGGPNVGTLSTATGLNWNNGAWNIYKIRWYPDRTEWIVNNTIIRTETVVRVGSPMGVWFNIWAPKSPANSGWGLAYDAAVAPAATAAPGKRYAFDVDYVRVRPIPKTGSALVGTGSGLSGAYYDQLDFSGLKLVRRDARVNFDWGVYAPDASMGASTFSARWSGSVQAQFSENYTFTVRADDGVRLWVNNRLIIDNWKDQTVTDSSGQIALQAGVKVPIRLEYYDNLDSARVKLSWSSASTPLQIVPQSQLYVASQPAPPTFSPRGGTYYTTQNVSLSSAATGATLRYTLDGSAPLASSPILAAGATLPVGAETVVRARAFVDGQIPSETSTASYLFARDTTAPALAITAPAPDAVTQTMPNVAGTVSDRESGVGRVDMVMTRLGDGLRWNGASWVNAEIGLAATISGSNWSVANGLPSGANLIPGPYELKAVAFDVSGNVTVKIQNLTIAAPIAPQISAPVASPASLTTGESTSLSVDVSDGNGAGDLRYVHLMLAPVGASRTSPATGLWLYFNAVEQKIYAWTGDGWGSGLARGAAGTLTTPQGSLTFNSSSIAPITNGYRLSVLFTPNSGYIGAFVLRALPQDSQTRNGWDLETLRDGSSVSITAPNVAPQISAPVASPTTLTTGNNTTLSVDVSDGNGAGDLRYVHLMLAPVGASRTSPATGLWLYFGAVEQKLYAWTGSGWSNGIARGAIATLTTPQGVVNVTASSIAPITNGYRLSVVFTPNSGYIGSFILRALPQDSQTRNGWDLDTLRDGSSVSINALNIAPQVSAPTASPSALTTGESTSLSVDVSDGNGANDLRYVHLMLAPVGASRTSPATGLWLYFNAVEQRIYAWTGDGWGSGLARGAAGTLTTPQGLLTFNSSSIASITNGYRLSVAFTPNASYIGAFVLRALPQDSQTRNGWDLETLRDGSSVSINAPSTAASAKSSSSPSGGSS